MAAVLMIRVHQILRYVTTAGLRRRMTTVARLTVWLDIPTNGNPDGQTVRTCRRPVVECWRLKTLTDCRLHRPVVECWRLKTLTDCRLHRPVVECWRLKTLTDCRLHSSPSHHRVPHTLVMGRLLAERFSTSIPTLASRASLSTQA